MRRLADGRTPYKDFARQLDDVARSKLIKDLKSIELILIINRVADWIFDEKA